MSCGDFFLAFIAILFPPIAVWIKSGICTADSLINIALCCLGYLPGLLHAWYIIARNPEHDYDYQPIDNERGEGDRVTYYYVSHTPSPSRTLPEQQQPQRSPGAMNYGSTTSQHLKPSHGDSAPQSHLSPLSAHRGPVAGSSNREQQHDQDGGNAPPPYDDAIQGDHKVQRSD